MKAYSQEKCTEFMARATLQDIARWGVKNPTYLSKNYGTLLNRLYHMKVWVTHRNGEPEYCTTGDINEFVNMIMNRTSIGDLEYDILNVVSNVIYAPDYKGHDLEEGNVSIRNKAILLSLMDSNKIKNRVDLCFGDERDAVISELYRLIIDVYIPTNNPEELIGNLMEVGLHKIVQNEGSTEWVMQVFQSITEVHSTNLKEIVIFCKIISDIYRNHEASKEFITLLHRMIHKQYWIRTEAQVIVDRYQKFFDDSEGEGYLFVSTLFGLLSDDNIWRSFQKINQHSDPSKMITNEVDEFLLQYSAKKNRDGLNFNNLKCMIGDIWQVISRHDSYNIKRDRCAFVAQKILEGWGNSRYDVSDSIKESNIDTSTPITTLESYAQIATEAIHKDSAVMNTAEKKIYKAYRTYKDAEEKVDSQITKAVNDLKNVATGDVREEIIEGKKFSAIGLLKRVLGTVGLFSIGPVKACIALVIKYALKKKTTESERAKILMEIDTELEMLNEKINDARGDNNREAKYAMMRTKKELENAKTRIMYGMQADSKSLSDTKKTLDISKQERTV